MFDENSPWPPAPYEHVMAACAERQVWWEGDPDKLAQFYGGSQGDVVRSKNVTQRARKAWASFWGSSRSWGAPHAGSCTDCSGHRQDCCCDPVC